MRCETKKWIHYKGSCDIVEFAQLDRSQAGGDLGGSIFLAFSRSQTANLFARMLAGRFDSFLSGDLFASGGGGGSHDAGHGAVKILVNAEERTNRYWLWHRLNSLSAGFV